MFVFVVVVLVVSSLAIAQTPIELSWIAPTVNTDGTPITDLAEFRVYERVGEEYVLLGTLPAEAAQTRCFAESTTE